MKYIPIRSFEDVSAALNFQKQGLLLDGGCDLYSVKAVADDKKLYAKIHETLNAKHQDNLRVAASLPPAYAKDYASTVNLSRDSPFGNLSESKNRRKFAHLIAALNATHTDHDFSNVLRPDDFVRIRSADAAIAQIDSKIYDAHSGSLPSGLQTPGGSDVWNPKMWLAIDKEMGLYNSTCEIYAYKPQDNPFADDEEGTAYWDMHYLFLNTVPRVKSKRKNDKKKNAESAKKPKPARNSKLGYRVCYLYLRAVRQPVYYDWSADDKDALKRSHSIRDSVDLSSARKKTKFWTGEQPDNVDGYFYPEENGYYENEDDSGVEYDPAVYLQIARSAARDESPIVIEESE